MDAFVKCSKV